MALMAMTLQSILDFEVDIARVLKMILIHDLAENYAGDYVAFEDLPPTKHDEEKSALASMIRNLPEETAEEFMQLWLEFEENQTNEAKFVNALDKLEAVIQQNQSDLSTWDEKEFDFILDYGKEDAEFSEVLKEYRQIIKSETLEKLKNER